MRTGFLSGRDRFGLWEPTQAPRMTPPTGLPSHTHGFILKSTSCNSKTVKLLWNCDLKGSDASVNLSLRLIKVTFNLLIEVSEPPATNSSIKVAR